MIGQIEELKTLIQGNEDLNARDNRGDTALHWAARKGLRDGVISLLEAGADFYLGNYEGKRPIDVADNDEVNRLELNINIKISLTMSYVRILMNFDPMRGLRNDYNAKLHYNCWVSVAISRGHHEEVWKFLENVPSWKKKGNEKYNIIFFLISLF